MRKKLKDVKELEDLARLKKYQNIITQIRRVKPNSTPVTPREQHGIIISYEELLNKTLFVRAPTSYSKAILLWENIEKRDY